MLLQSYDLSVAPPQHLLHMASVAGRCPRLLPSLCLSLIPLLRLSVLHELRLGIILSPLSCLQ